MAKVAPFRGSSPSGWSRERWDWRKAVVADGRLSMCARLLATELAFGFANHETAECSPGIKALTEAIGVHRATVMRAMAELVAAGWIDRLGGEGPNKRASYLFRTPQRVAEPRQERVATLRPEPVAEPRQERVADLEATCRNSEIPPTPPYKDKPNMNQITSAKRWPRSATKVTLAGGVRPTQFSQLVEVGSAAEAGWNEWLAAHGFPELSKIGHKIGVGMLVGWDMPSRWPPSDGDEPASAIALRFADWLRSKA